MGGDVSRIQAQARVDRLRVFLDQLAELERDGILQLTEEQRAKVAEHHQATVARLAAQFDIDTTDSERQLSWGMRIASTLGAVALCIAVALFAARFLGHLRPPMQLAILGATPLLLLACAEYAARRERSLYFTGLLAMIAFAAFVVDLELAGRIFSLAPTTNALLAWGAFALALAYHYSLRLPLATGLVCLLGWTLIRHLYPWWFWEEGDAERVIVAGAGIALAPLLLPHGNRPEFPAVFRLVGWAGMFLAFAVIALDGRSALLSTWDRSDTRLVYQYAALLVAAAVIWLGIARRWSETVDAGSVAFVLFLLIRLGNWLWDDIPKYLFFFLVGAIGIALLLVFRRLRTRLAVAQ